MYIKQTKCSLNIEPSIDYMALKLENGLNGNACWKNRNPKVEKYGALDRRDGQNGPEFPWLVTATYLVPGPKSWLSDLWLIATSPILRDLWLVTYFDFSNFQWLATYDLLRFLKFSVTCDLWLKSHFLTQIWASRDLQFDSWPFFRARLEHD